MSATTLQPEQSALPRTSEAPRDEPVAPANGVGFVVVAIATAFALLLVPSGRLDRTEVALAAGVAAATLGLALLWRWIPAVSRIGVPLCFLAVAALLRDAAGGATSGFGGLFLLPVLWLALTAGRRELGIILAAMLSAQLTPILLDGGSRYPQSTWRGAVILTSVAALMGLMVQRLVGAARSREALLQAQAETLSRTSAQLAEQNDRLLELDRLKDDFIAVVSHELRTPLTSIAGYLDMALDPEEEPLPPAVEGYLRVVRRNVDRLIGLVGQLLFLTRADSHPLELDLRPLDLREVLHEAFETARPTAQAKGIDLAVVAAEGLPPVLADRAELLRLLDNLASNAVRYTPSGGRVELRARREGERAVVEVADTGIGIAAHELPKIFKRFFRASSAVTNGIPGTGLGLAISQVVAEAHGTTITVESSLGNGSTFSARLPFAG
jgi:signal transduction histidine kinase